MPAWPVNATCAALVAALDDADDADAALVAAAAGVTDMYFGNGADAPCMETLPDGPGGVPGDGPGDGPWGWQSCTEVPPGRDVYQFISLSPRTVAKSSPSMSVGPRLTPRGFKPPLNAWD
jgi:hypothetical protein